MRIRGTKPEFWKSKRIASVSWADRLLLKGLESYVDDNGVGVDDVELIVTDVFPRDMFASPRETIARVSEGISRLHQAGLVWRYTHEDDHLLYISFWEDIQRIDKPGKGRNPRPDGTWDYKESSIRESVASPPETVAPVTGEQGNRGTGEQSSSSAKLPAVAKPPREDVEQLCRRLRDHISGNTAKTPNITSKWRTEARLLLDRDEIGFDEAVRVLDWCQADHFWKGNILSMPKFREKFTQLQIKSQQSNVTHFPARQSASERAQGHLDTVAEAERLMGLR